MSRSRVIEKRSPRYEQIKRTMSSQTRFGLSVGIFDTEVSQYAAFHEFGTGYIPARSFIRSWFATTRLTNIEHLRMLAQTVWANRPVSTMATSIGQESVTEMKNNILSSIPPPLSPRTIAAKTGPFKTIPLIDTGRLIRSITYRIIT